DCPCVGRPTAPRSAGLCARALAMRRCLRPVRPLSAPPQGCHAVPGAARSCPVPAAIACQSASIAAFPRATFYHYGTHPMSTALRDQIFGLITPFNKKGVELTDATTFAGDLEWDSLTVMDFVAEVEDTDRKSTRL